MLQDATQGIRWIQLVNDYFVTSTMIHTLFQYFLRKGLDCQGLLDLQDCIEENSRNNKNQYFEIGYCNWMVDPVAAVACAQAERMMWNNFKQQ